MSELGEFIASLKDWRSQPGGTPGAFTYYTDGVRANFPVAEQLYNLMYGYDTNKGFVPGPLKGKLTSGEIHALIEDICRLLDL